MPSQTVSVPPELFLTHNGVHVYHTYKDDDIGCGCRLFWYTLWPREEGDDAVQFDVRDLQAGISAANHEAHKRAIREALDDGRLDPPAPEDNLPWAHTVLVEVGGLPPDADAAELVERALSLAQDEARDAVLNGDQSDDPESHERLKQIKTAEFDVTTL